MRKFRELDVWKAARQASVSSYRLTMSAALRTHFTLRDQIRRAATSIPANLAEGYGLSSRAQLIRCARIALGSANELQVHLELVMDLSLADPELCQDALKDCQRATQLLIGLLRGLGAKAPR